MGIDIYTRWDDQTAEEREAQITGFSTLHGHVGYLREAYHGEPYATRVLAPEAFNDDYDDEAEEYRGAAIPASVLRERLPATLAAARERIRTLYHGNPDDPATAKSVQSFEEFVALIERLEADGRNPRIVASW